MPTLKAEYNGQVFVPCEHVTLPAGTRVEILVPVTREATEQEQQEWQDIRSELSRSTAYYPTLDEAMRQSRKRP